MVTTMTKKTGWRSIKGNVVKVYATLTEVKVNLDRTRYKVKLPVDNSITILIPNESISVDQGYQYVEIEVFNRIAKDALFKLGEYLIIKQGESPALVRSEFTEVYIE